MRVLLDINVLLDFLLAREPFATEAREIWLACEQERCTGYLAAISVTNIWYIGRRLVGTDAARQHVADLLRVMLVRARYIVSPRRRPWKSDERNEKFNDTTGTGRGAGAVGAGSVR
jgi:predicted nucleic acid-binding protein